jgi:hypothetical protein
MATMEDALALVPPKEADEPKPGSDDLLDPERRLELMPLEDFIDYVMVPPEEEQPLLVWTFEGLVEHFVKRAKGDDDLSEITKGAMLEDAYDEKMAYDTAKEAAEGESLLQKVAEWGIKKVIRLLFNMLVKGVYRLLSWFIREVVYRAITGLVEWLIRPVLMEALGFIGLNPELWPFIAVLGGLSAFAYLVYDKLNPKDKETLAGEGTDESDLVQAATSGPRDVSPRTGAAYPNAAGAPDVSGAADGSLGGLISRGEGGYSSVNKGAAHGYAAGTEDLEHMTVAEVMAHQRAQDFNAVGRYQIIKPTLAAAVQALHLTGNELFNKQTQDRIFEQYLIGIKRHAIGDYISGKSNDINAAVLAASQEWASVAAPVGARLNNGGTGDGRVSYYAGTANNRASISAAEMARALESARASQSALGSSTQVQAQTIMNKPGVVTAPSMTNSQVNQATSAAQNSSAVPQPQGDKTIVVGRNKELIAVNTS